MSAYLVSYWNIKTTDYWAITLDYSPTITLVGCYRLISAYYRYISISRYGIFYFWGYILVIIHFPVKHWWYFRQLYLILNCTIGCLCYKSYHTHLKGLQSSKLAKFLWPNTFYIYNILISLSCTGWVLSSTFQHAKATN